MGAWTFVDRRIEEVLRSLDIKAKRPDYVGRGEAASPATGLAKVHAQQQEALVRRRSACSGRRPGARRTDRRRAMTRDPGSHPGRERDHRDGGALAEAGRRGGGGGRAAGGAGDRQGHGGGQCAVRRRDREHRRREGAEVSPGAVLGAIGAPARAAAAKPRPRPPPRPPRRRCRRRRRLPAPAGAAPAQPRVEAPRAPSGPVAVPARGAAATRRCRRREDDGREEHHGGADRRRHRQGRPHHQGRRARLPVARARAPAAPAAAAGAPRARAGGGRGAGEDDPPAAHHRAAG